MSLLRSSGAAAGDSPSAPHRSPDPGDDYLLALAESERAVLVSGDRRVLGLGTLPVRAPRPFVEMLDTAS